MPKDRFKANRTRDLLRNEQDTCVVRQHRLDTALLLDAQREHKPQQTVEEFLSQGGDITHVAAGVRGQRKLTRRSKLLLTPRNPWGKKGHGQAQ